MLPFIPFERTAATPFYRQIYHGYRDAILAGRLRPGQRLPSTRVLAAELKISRLPVLVAFEQLLHEGYLEGKVGSGTYVKHSIPGESAARPPQKAAKPARPPEPLALHASEWVDQGLGAFRVSAPALDHFPHRIWSRLVSQHVRNPTAEQLAYGDPAGHLPLREAIAQYLLTERAVHCEAGQILIVSGSQMALQICGMALLAADDAVCLEEPGYPGARDALRNSAATIVPVRVDDQGIDVAALASQGERARAVYVTPSHQYPLGISMTVTRRLELLAWAQRNDAWIIEDDYDSEYRYTSRPLSSLQGMESASRVIYLGTFSKVLFPSLRIGYVVVPPALWSTFVRLRETLDIFSPTLYQLALADFLRGGHFSRHLRRMRTLYHARRNALVESLRRHAGDLLTIYNADAGLHLSAFLRPGIDDREVVRCATARGVYATPLSTCYAGHASKSGLLLGFGGAEVHLIDDAVRTLVAVIRELA